MRYLSGSGRILAACAALLGACLAGPGALGQQARPPAGRPDVTAVSPTLQQQVQQQQAPPVRASFSLQAPSTVEAGRAFAVTVVRDRRDGQTYDFTLQFEPDSLVATEPERIIVAENEDSRSVRLVTIANPPGDGPHRLRVLLTPGKSRPTIATRVVDITVTEPRPPAPRFSLSAPAAVEAGRAFWITIARDSSDGRAHDVRLQFEPAGLLADPPNEITIPDDPGSATVRLVTRADPPGDGPHRLRVVLSSGASGARIGTPRLADVSVTETPPPTFSLRAPAEVEAGDPLAVTIVRDRSDGRTHDFRLRFEPAGLVADPPGRITVGPDQKSGTVRVTTLPDPPGDGRHPLRIVLLAGDSGPRIGAPRSVDVAVNEPPPPPATFSLRAPAEVTAGDRLPIEIVRAGNDGRAHTLQLSYGPAGLLDDPPVRAIVGSADERWAADLATVADPPGDGPHVLRIVLRPGGSSASIAVREQPAPVVTTTADADASYVVRAPNSEVGRGDAIVFTVTRRGGAGQTRIPYEVVQAGSILSSGTFVFEGEGSQSRTVNGYDSCGEGPWLRLAGEAGAQALLSSVLPGNCPGPESFWEEWWPWWAVPLLLPLAWPVRTVFRRIRDVLRERRRQRLISGMRSDFEVDPGEAALPDGQPRLRGPAIAIRFRTVAGAADSPSPLPLKETADV